MSAPSINGMVHLSSPYSVPETADRIENLLAERNINLVARLDHAKAAAVVGLEMRPTQLLIFGNPQAGTPLMIASPTIAIDLPLKALVWEDADGSIWLSYNAPEYLGQRHHVPNDLLANIAGLRSILEKAVRKENER